MRLNPTFLQSSSISFTLSNTSLTSLSPSRFKTSTTMSEAFPLPPLETLPDGVLFPSFPQMLQTKQKLGGVFTYKIAGDRRMTFIADPAAYRVVFYAKDSEDVELDSPKLAYHWFGIRKDIAKDYTLSGLEAVRQAMVYGKMRKANDEIGVSVLKEFASWPSSGEGDMWDVALLTFWPVVQHLFGEETFSPQLCPHALSTLWRYDEDFRKVANGMPRAMFPEMEERAKELADIFARSIKAGNHLKDSCPVLKARVGVLDDPDHKKYSPEDKARFAFSIYWASQGNTIPGTFWMLLLIANDPRVLAKVTKEVREHPEFSKATTKFDINDLPYLTACMKETLRLKVANITHRKVKKEIVVQDSEGNKFTIPKGDTVTAASYLEHHDPSNYPDPEKFYPERWLENSYKDTQWFPFGAGTNQCSGRHLAQMELVIIAGLLFREYDVELLEPVPAEKWENTVAMVGPEKRSCKFKFKKRE